MVSSAIFVAVSFAVSCASSLAPRSMRKVMNTKTPDTVIVVRPSRIPIIAAQRSVSEEKAYSVSSTLTTRTGRTIRNVAIASTNSSVANCACQGHRRMSAVAFEVLSEVLPSGVGRVMRHLRGNRPSGRGAGAADTQRGTGRPSSIASLFRVVQHVGPGGRVGAHASGPQGVQQVLHQRAGHFAVVAIA